MLEKRRTNLKTVMTFFIKILNTYFYIDIYYFKCKVMQDK